MKAIVHTAFGPPQDVLQLQEVARPTPSAGTLLVRVEAVALAKGDWLIANGLPYIARPSYGVRSPKQPIAGLAVAGTVTETGDGVSDFVAGDEVFGSCAGALAEFVAVPQESIVAKPPNVSWAQAAAAAVSGLAALQGVRDEARVQPGERVLVIGASGGVGAFAVQIAKSLGADVTGVASTRNLEMLRRIGADHVIDYTREAITAAHASYDVIIDLAGNRPVSLLRRALTPEGRLVIIGGTGGRWTMGFGRTIGAMLLNPFVRQRLVGMISTPTGERLRALSDLMASGQVVPVIQDSFPLQLAAKAIELVGSGHAAGSIAVTV